MHCIEFVSIFFPWLQQGIKEQSNALKIGCSCLISVRKKKTKFFFTHLIFNYDFLGFLVWSSARFEKFGYLKELH